MSFLSLYTCRWQITTDPAGHRRSKAMPGPGPAAPSVTGTWPGPYGASSHGEIMQKLWRNHDKDGRQSWKNHEKTGWDSELSTSNLGIRPEKLSLMYICRWRDYRTICLVTAIILRFFPLGQGSQRLNLICSPCFGWAQGSAKTLQTCKPSQRFCCQE